MYNTKTLVDEEPIHVRFNDKELNCDRLKLVEQLVYVQILERPISSSFGEMTYVKSAYSTQSSNNTKEFGKEAFREPDDATDSYHSHK